MNNFFMDLCSMCQHNKGNIRKGNKKGGYYPCGKTKCFDPPKIYQPNLDSDE